MLFKGYKFRKTHRVVGLPVKDEHGNVMPYIEAGKESYVVFGKVTMKGEKKYGAIKTTYRWNHDKLKGQPVYAIPLPLKGYSLTNMAYGLDGYLYMMHDGQFYQSYDKLKRQ